MKYCIPVTWRHCFVMILQLFKVPLPSRWLGFQLIGFQTSSGNNLHTFRRFSVCGGKASRNSGTTSWVISVLNILYRVRSQSMLNLTYSILDIFYIAMFVIVGAWIMFYAYAEFIGTSKIHFCTVFHMPRFYGQLSPLKQKLGIDFTRPPRW
jgi:hypothetical protein